MELAKVNCGWKGCSNAFASIEGMNVHVQADHMVYRVLVQTEYQGNSHVQQPYDQQQPARAPAAVPQIMPVKEEARPQETTPPQSPLELQGGAPPPAAAPQPIAHPSIPPYSPMTIPQTPSLVLAPQLAPYPEVPVAPGAPRENLNYSGPIIKVEREIVIEDPAEIVQMPAAAATSSGALILNTPPPADVTLAASGDFSRGGATSSSSNRRISIGGGRGKDKKHRNIQSKFWTYTDQESYRCNAKSCGAEFSSANGARLHWNANHEVAAPIENRSATPSSSMVRAPASRKRVAGGGARRSASGNRTGTKRQKCNHDGCTKYFMSRKALDNHIQVIHGGQEREHGGLDQHSDDEEFEHQHVVASDDAEQHGDEHHEQEHHRGDEYEQEEEEEEDLQLGQDVGFFWMKMSKNR
ncbi:hypothetical protein B9Z55_027233 [Caenorhabditis nigoni]|uniref:C2H2-type domain-containing protein n=1 Tax=Caenorhabditis nigoni TaxID=1611254 RepID=A0A2G5SHC9_9PELO|nr:hypothetical protein B9Z55_027233 [Caenorhabditis nigoni]